MLTAPLPIPQGLNCPSQQVQQEPKFSIPIFPCWHPLPRMAVAAEGDQALRGWYQECPQLEVPTSIGPTSEVARLSSTSLENKEQQRSCRC